MKKVCRIQSSFNISHYRDNTVASVMLFKYLHSEKPELTEELILDGKNIEKSSTCGKKIKITSEEITDELNRPNLTYYTHVCFKGS